MKTVLKYMRWLWEHSVGARGAVLANILLGTVNVGLNLLFIYNIPFRGMAKMMGGMVSMQMAEDMLLMCNGHWHKGLVRLIHHYFHRPQLESQKKAKKA